MNLILAGSISLDSTFKIPEKLAIFRIQYLLRTELVLNNCCSQFGFGLHALIDN
jgi:hypothetical protein